MREQMAALYALQQQDSALDLLKKQFAALDSGRAEKPAYEAAQAAHTEIATIVANQTTELRDMELEQKSVETKRADFEKKLYSGKVNNPKELQAMQDEVEMLGRLRARLDDKMLTLMETLKSNQAQEAQAKATLSETRTALKARYAAYEQEATTIKAQAQELYNQRNAAAKEIPPALFKRYEALRAAKNGVAVAALEDSNACSGCKMGLPSQIVRAVHLGTDMQMCQNCGRMLFAPAKS
ncbi:MAG TPA: C4-type zinc ribbon domain-containing protein [Chthonomonadaceae bacterium]|nr:C4-type zinc ribbon domain-containing protein [Chthonomonadaceae bacterium]